MSYPKHVRATYINSKDFTNIDLAPLSPTKSSTSTQYAKFRNDRVLSVQDRRSRGQAVQPLGQRTKRSIFGLRRALLVVRTLQLLGAAGLLACLCLLGNIPDIQSYIVRAPACVDVATSAYGIYDLARSAKHRTPSSSSAYHFFALIIDAGLIPFYVFTAIIAHAEAGMAITDTQRWTTSVLEGSKTDIFIQATWLGAIIIGGLHLISFAASIYLCVVFRKIANLPPDMNPLGNLTTRPSGSIRRSRVTPAITANGNTRPMSALPRPMSFFGTRKNNSRNYSPHNPVAGPYASATDSRTNLAVPTSLDLFKPLPNSPRPAHGNRKITPRAETPPPLPDERQHDLKSMPSIISASSIYTNSIKSPAMPSAPAIPRKSSKRTRSEQLRDNWFVDSQYTDPHQPRASPLAEDDEDTAEDNGGFALWSSRNAQQEYVPVEQDRQGRLEYNDDLTADLSESNADIGTVRVRKSRAQQPVPGFMSPLEMNPPTPRGSRMELREEQLILQDSSENGGDARPRNALGLNLHGLEESGNENVVNGQVNGHLSYDLGRNKPAWELPQRPDSGIDRTSPIAGPRRQVQARVLSRSGADIGDNRLGYDADDFAYDDARAGLRGRNVSGKIAEEGLGGY